MVQEKAERIAREVHYLLTEERKASVACRLGELNKSYYLEAAERGEMSVKALVAALDALEMDLEDLAIYLRTGS